VVKKIIVLAETVEKWRYYGSPILLLPFPQQMRREEDIEDHSYPFPVAHKINTEETECRWNLFSLIIDYVQVPIYSHDPSGVILV